MGMTKTQFILWVKHYYWEAKKTIKIGDYVEALIHVITLGFGHRIASYIATSLGYPSCKCCERKQWLNRLTNKHYDGECGQIKLF